MENSGGKKRRINKRTRDNRKGIYVVKKVENNDSGISRLENLDTSTIERFSDFPISPKTLSGLNASSFLKPTEIQRESLPFSLRGLDILGAAKTGSGKTLAFIIPILEHLHHKKWNNFDGLGALVVTPVRELAYQIFEVLQKVGKKYDFSAGLIIGGREVNFEKRRLDKCNVIICTPGRLQQHMDENPLFDATNLQILVLDEADRILDMGFKSALNAILENIPTERQTILFSATQTKSVKDLARLSLRDPVYVSVHEHSKYSTPESLKQSYIVCELHDKICLLWSFLKYHAKQKILVFMSTCKEVRYVSELFSRIRRGLNVMGLFGTMKQGVRMEVYDEFCSKSSAVLIATDVAARGLDFPSVDWVIQADCPIDASEYIHRVGRTARYEKDGESLLFLLPSEEAAMVAELKSKKIPISQIKINPKNRHSIQLKLECMLARDVDLKSYAQGAFVSYMKSVFLMKKKNVFDVTKLDSAAYARSLGLAIPPRVRFLQKQGITLDRSTIKDTPFNSFADTSEETRRNVDSAKKFSQNFYNFDTGVDSDDEVYTVHRRFIPDVEIKDLPPVLPSRSSKKVITKEDVALKILRKNITANVKLVFDEAGEVVMDAMKQQVSAASRGIVDDDIGGIDIEKAKLVMQEEDKIDKKVHREKLKARRLEKKLKEKKLKKPENKSQEEEEDDDDSGGDDDDGVQLRGGSDDDDGGSVDLDFLPDPDKFYGKQSSAKDDEELSEDIAEKQAFTNNKRKRTMESKTKTKKSRSARVEQGLDTGLQLADDEELALHLLNM